MVKEHLTDDGIMVVNMNMHTEEKGNINEYLSDTIASVFPDVYTADVANTTNRELFAGNGVNPGDRIRENMDQISDGQLRRMMSEVSANLVRYQKGDYLLTDDQAPVELLGIQVIDSLIQDEVSYYKDIFQREGIQGLLNSF